MRTVEKNIELERRLFAASENNFNELAVEVFEFQYKNNSLYRQYCDMLKTDVRTVDSIVDIPFLPISFFKTHKVMTGDLEPLAVFESSGTTGTTSSKHFVKDLELYKKSFTNAFTKFYGHADNYCILGLLPSYLERGNSSLVMMVDELIKQSNNKLSGFYLHDHEKLHSTIMHNELVKQPTLLIGVTYALLDFAAQYPMQLRNIIVMETGGMKGRRKEMTREEVHQQLQNQFGITAVHSEYGMTELLSQAYSKGDGFFHCPPWMKVLLRAEDDPMEITGSNENTAVTGVINIIDLANLYSCSFIATDDMGRLNSSGSFEVLGRMDNSDIRGCSLMVL